MAKKYQVIHYYEEEDSYGYPIRHAKILVECSTKKDAEDIVKEYSNPHFYNKTSYASYSCGNLKIKEKEEKTYTCEEFLKICPKESCFWLAGDKYGPHDILPYDLEDDEAEED